MMNVFFEASRALLGGQ